jgi:hypothetical protein
VDGKASVAVAIKKIPRFTSAQILRGDQKPAAAPGLRATFSPPISLPDKCAYERIYACPPALILEPQTEYQISGRVDDRGRSDFLFEFDFYTNSRGRPAAF